MRKIVIVVLAVVVLGAALWSGTRRSADAPGGPANAGGGAGALGRPPMTVEFAQVERGDVAEHLTVVGNLIGAATVDIVPKVNGRLESVSVRLGDRVSRGQMVAKIEDSEIHEQVKQADASFDVARATIRQREADLKFAETNLDRSRNLYGRQLLPRQTLDDAEARYQAAAAQLDLARAQFTQAGARREELRITLNNTVIRSPVEGFVGKRNLDAGAFASSNAPVLSLVDIRQVRLVVNLVEKDLRRVSTGAVGAVEVDAFPGETFEGRVARIAPVLDPATRTAEMEIEIPNQAFRLKPGMYARVRLTTARHPNALVVPRNSIVDLEGRRGVFMAVPREGGAGAGGSAASPGGRSGSARGGAGASAQGAAPGGPSLQARFVPVKSGIEDGDRVEILEPLREGDRVITTGAAALRDGDPLATASPVNRADRRGAPAAPATR